ncbi:hypothetical protein DTO021D3_3429 [Paecilomyces variotii]|nr:hypothetical protein DTO032I3_6545 [Paecilomyces variotii]KAJ9279638.1 hypothetical protein DTO021D3_3429 [Paecilomyces variotii]KAJ9347391.1 hypothetical protein DTO027B6_265 [Paecilomyces variotii]KAJ9358690.1 hypothetical protein DTO027B9_2363 [Paecilomyces variotii]KAJ9372246.1 hypothetical protein DTO282E5_3088 [Paecilomyces variotii]
MRIHRLAALGSISSTRKPQQLNPQKQQQQQPQPQPPQLPAQKHTATSGPQATPSLRLPYPRTRQDFLAYRLSGISRHKLCQESSDPEHDLRRYVGNAAVNRASVDWKLFETEIRNERIKSIVFRDPHTGQPRPSRDQLHTISARIYERSDDEGKYIPFSTVS